MFFEPKEPQRIIGVPFTGEAKPLPGLSKKITPAPPKIATTKPTTKATTKEPIQTTKPTAAITTKPTTTTRMSIPQNAFDNNLPQPKIQTPAPATESAASTPTTPAGPLEQLAVNSQPTKATTRPTMPPKATEAPDFFKPEGKSSYSPPLFLYKFSGAEVETTTNQPTTSTEKTKKPKKDKKEGPSSSSFTYLSSVLLIIILF